mmetsp:Transcript_15053/g.32129  ORF Transcript_15053/g.32129 Transcript_15053/m.32129 type:complete len:663 (-) Transcript_15053:611-2599(-)
MAARAYVMPRGSKVSDGDVSILYAIIALSAFKRVICSRLEEVKELPCSCTINEAKCLSSVEVRRGCQQPFGLHFSARADVALGGEHVLLVADPLWLRLDDRRRVERHQLVVVERAVLRTALVPRHLDEEAAEQTAAHGLISAVCRHVALARRGKLAVEVEALEQLGERDAHVRDCLERARVEEVIKGPLGRVAIRSVGGVCAQQRQVIARRVREVRLGGVGGLAKLARTHERRGQAEQRRERQHLLDAPVLHRLEEHLPELRLERQLGQHLSGGGEVGSDVERAEMVEELEGAHHGLGRRRVDEVKLGYVGHAETLQLQHERAQLGAQHLRVGLHEQVRAERRLRVQAEALAGARSACTSGALLGGGPRDGRDDERLDAQPRVVELLLCEARVDHIHDAVDRQRRLSHVCRKHDLACVAAALSRARRRFKDESLLLHGQRRVERQHQHLARLWHGVDLLLCLAASLLDLLLAGQKDEHIAGRLVQVNLQHGAYGGVEIVLHGLRRVVELHRVEPPRHRQQRRVVKVAAELLGVERRAHDNHLELRPQREQLLDEAEEQVGGECALVRLVEHDGGVAPERRVVHRLAQQHPVGQVLEYRLGPARVVEADGVANLLAQRDAKLLRDAFRHRHGRHATRLRARDQLPIGARQRVEQKRRDLRCLP